MGFAESATSGTSAADTLVTAVTSGNDNFVLTNQVGQIVASVVGAIRVLQPVAIQVNVFAGTTTFLKLVIDIQDGRQIDPGDVFNLVGNIAGTVGTIAVFAGASPAIITVASGISIAAGIAGVISGDNFTRLSNWTSGMIQQYWSTSPVPVTRTLYVTGNGALASYDEIMANPDLQIMKIVVTPDRITFEEDPNPPPPTDENADGDGL
jgi:hypothetical protein